MSQCLGFIEFVECCAVCARRFRIQGSGFRVKGLGFSLNPISTHPLQTLIGSADYVFLLLAGAIEKAGHWQWALRLVSSAEEAPRAPKQLQWGLGLGFRV